jgi:hypothetical protein
MATIGTSQYTLIDVAESLAPSGGVLPLAELLTQGNEILEDIPWYEGNLPTGHRIGQRTGLPAVYYRKMNAGIPTSKSTRVQIDEACGEMVALSQIDKSLADLNGNSNEFRMKEALAFIEAMNQRFATATFYADTKVNGEEILGLAPRFSSLSADNGVNIIDAGGTGSSNTSLWLVGWAPHTCYGIYPKGSTAGLDFNRGESADWLFDSNNNRFRGYIDEYKWQNGVALEDWRYVVRIANIDVTTLTKTGGSGADLFDLIAQAAETIHSTSGVTPRFYGNRTVSKFLRRQQLNKVVNSTLGSDEVAGKKVMTLAEIPFRRVDALVNTETRVV